MSSESPVAFLASIPTFSEASQIIPTVNALVGRINANIISPLNQVIYPTIPAAPVNLLGVTVGATGNPVLLSPNGSAVDTNVGMIVAGRGSGPLSLGGTSSATASIQVVNLTNSANFLQVTGATSASPLVTLAVSGATAAAGLLLAAASSGVVSLGGSTSANASLQVITSGASARQVTITGSATNPTISTTAGSLAVTPATVFASSVTVNGGSVSAAKLGVSGGIAITGALAAAVGANTLTIDNPTADQIRFIGGGHDNATVANIVFDLQNSAGGSSVRSLAMTSTGSIMPGLIALGGTTSALASLRVVSLANSANWLEVTGATSAAPNVNVAAVGSTAEVFLQLTPQGTSSATVKFGNATCFQANGAVTIIPPGASGPTNSHSDVQKWLRIIDQAGASLFIPCY